MQVCFHTSGHRSAKLGKNDGTDSLKSTFEIGSCAIASLCVVFFIIVNHGIVLGLKKVHTHAN